MSDQDQRTPPDEREPAENTDSSDEQLAERRRADAADTDDDAPGDLGERADAADAEERADAADAEERADADDDEQPEGRRRPSLLVIIGSAVLLVAIGVGLGTLIPAGPPPQPTAAPLPTPLPLPEAVGEADSAEPIARVNGVEIQRGDFVRVYQPGADPLQLLDQLIMRELVVQAAGSEGVEVDQAAVTAEIDQIRLAEAGGDQQRFATFLIENKLVSEDNLRRLIGRDQLIEQMVLRHTTAEQVRARHILLSATPEEAEARKAEAEELLAQLEGGADFAALASEKSEDSGSKEQGGDLGWAPRGAFVGPFDEAVFSMEVGELRLVQTDFGWHIIELLEAPEVRSFSDMAYLNTPSGQQAFEESFLPWADKLKADAEAANQIEVLVQAEDLVNSAGQS